MGTSYVLRLAEELEINEEIALLMAHMVLSHHSEPDYGSPAARCSRKRSCCIILIP
jgi:23S rRNA maturation-related 3'-5' exoribonuclease YhaM